MSNRNVNRRCSTCNVQPALFNLHCSTCNVRLATSNSFVFSLSTATTISSRVRRAGSSDPTPIRGALNHTKTATAAHGQNTLREGSQKNGHAQSVPESSIRVQPSNQLTVKLKLVCCGVCDPSVAVTVILVVPAGVGVWILTVAFPTLLPSACEVAVIVTPV